MTQYFELEPHDPLIARDNRPFGAGGGNRMRPVKWFPPSVGAGTVRTAVGRAVDGTFPAELVKRLKSMEVAGPLPADVSGLYFPAPADAVWLKVEGVSRVQRQSPLEVSEEDGGTDLPENLLPVYLEKQAGVKPVKGPDFWSQKRMVEWLLTGNLTDSYMKGKDAKPCSGFWNVSGFDERWHVMLRPESGTAEDQRLFLTSGIPFPEGVRLAMRWSGELGNAAEGWSTVGGERRLARWQPGDGKMWATPEEIRSGVGRIKRFRMVLATPGMFKGGWLPGWIDSGSYEGTIPGTGTQVKLRAAAVGRWTAVSGFSMERAAGKFGRRPIRRLAPAGSVYYFDHIGGDAMDVDKIWLRPVSDVEDGIFNAARDGFGLALWGLWIEES